MIGIEVTIDTSAATHPTARGPWQRGSIYHIFQLPVEIVLNETWLTTGSTCARHFADINQDAFGS